MNSPLDLQTEDAAAGRRWRFSTVAFDERTLELSVSGTPVDIERKPLEVLRILLEHAGEIVTKDELLAAAWPGRVLSDTSLAKAVARLRDAIGEEAAASIKTVHGYGYRLTAPVSIETGREAPAPHFDFRAGDHPPHRPLWSLERPLGAGSHGEVWLVRHDKTRERRVLKFALDEASLLSLKREITLFRLLRDSLGDRARVVTLKDWNLEQAPYFLEAELVEGGSLADWCGARGGVASIPMHIRIEIVARIADAVSTVHSIGVLHKDLKPSNILIPDPAAECPDVVLGDLGSGGLLDPARLAALGITRLGFTQTVNVSDSGSGTPLYLAPELLAGQPPTVQSDVFALGVLLYQIVVGDFHRTLAAGWEREIDDELIRSDIAAAAEGVVSHRLDSAGELARRLRSIASRRDELARLRLQGQREEETRRRADRASARRVATVAAIAILAVGLIASTILWLDARNARRAADSERATAQAVADFLSRDMFATLGRTPLRDLTVPQLLAAASEKLTQRVESPEASAKIHSALGSAFLTMEDIPSADRHLDEALILFGQRDQNDRDLSASLAAAAQSARVKSATGALAAARVRYDDLLALGEARLGPLDPGVFQLRTQLAIASFYTGAWTLSARLLTGLTAQADSVAVRDEAMIGTARSVLADVLVRLGRFEEAEKVIEVARNDLVRAFGASQAALPPLDGIRGFVLAQRGDYRGAESIIDDAVAEMTTWVKPGPSAQVASIDYYRGRTRLLAGKPGDAIVIFRNGLGVAESLKWDRDQTAEIRTWLGRAYLDSGDSATARGELSSAAASAGRAFGDRHPQTQIARIWYAESLLLSGDPEAGRVALAAVDPQTMADLGNGQLFNREWKRVQALLDQPSTAHPGRS